MIKNLLYTCFLLLLTGVAKAQPPAYAFQAVSGTYTAIAGTTVPLTYNAVANNDDGITTPANAIPIGFSFNYNGTNYTTIKPCANGWASFSATALTNNTDTWTNNLATGPAANQRALIAPLWDDLDMGSGSVSYQLSGVTPNQVLTIQWANAKWDYNAGSPVMSFQVKLYETSNVIEFIYRQEAGTIATNSGGCTIGISATATTAGAYWSLSDAGSNPQLSSSVETGDITTKPATGQVYRWIPLCTAGTTNTTGEKISNFNYSTINNNSAGTAGYENFSAQSTTVQPSSSLPFSVSVSNFTANDQVVILIDYNHNGSFADAGETVFTSTVPLGSGTVSGTLNIPAFSANVLQGVARLRIRLHDTGNGPNATGCGTATNGQVEDYSINIQPCFAAAVSSQPPNTFICNGGTGTISTTITGTGITYQWQLSVDGGANYNNISNGTTYAGVTTNSLTISGATASMSGYKYRVLLTGTCTSANTVTSGATLTINTAAAISLQPVANVKICKGDSTSFTAAATGSSVQYQWQVSSDGGISYSTLLGETSSTLKLGNASISLNGNRYRVMATVASCGSVLSTPAILTVNPLPVVNLVVQPALQIQPGQHTFVTVGSVPPGMSFSWTRNGIVLPAATTNAVFADVNGFGKYQVTVTDANGCKNISNEVEVSPLESQKVFIYPNPNRGQFHVRLYSPWLTKQVTIYNSAGAIVNQKNYEAASRYLELDYDLGPIASGFYTIRVRFLYYGVESVGSFIVQ